MTHLSANPIRQIIAAVLAVSLSVCCCQTHFLLHGFSDGETSGTAGVLDNVPGKGPACCDGCADEPSESPDDDDSPSPLKSCKTCCIKGSGLKDIGSVLLDTDLVVAPAFVLSADVVYGEERCFVIRPTVDAARLRVEPRTLVRLHCALLV